MDSLSVAWFTVYRSRLVYGDVKIYKATCVHEWARIGHRDQD